MARYQFEKNIPSVFVDKDLLRQLEDYLMGRLPKKLKSLTDKDEIDFSFSITLHEKHGKEYLNSVRELHRDKFQSDIERVDIYFSTNYQLIDIDISFSLGYFGSIIRIDFRSENGKEITYGIYREIEQLLEDNKTIHFLFNGKFVFFVYLFYPLLIALGFFTKGKTAIPYMTETVTFIALLGLSYSFIERISPYSTFDTKKQEIRNKFSKWIVNGLASVFIFGVLATFIRSFIFNI